MPPKPVVRHAFALSPGQRSYPNMQIAFPGRELPFLHNVLALARAAQAAYSIDDAPLPDSAESPMEHVTFCDMETQTRVCASRRAQGIVLAFRGTHHPLNLVTNLNVRLTPGFGGMVHQGFMLAWTKVRASVTALLDGRSGQRQDIWLTGHSLGGALAILAGADLKGQGVGVHQIVTFGAPRVGDAAFARAYHVPTACFINHGDPIPWLPPGLRRVGTAWHFLSDGKLVHDLPLWQQLLERTLDFALQKDPALAFRKQVLASLESHSLAAYLSRLHHAL